MWASGPRLLVPGFWAWVSGLLGSGFWAWASGLLVPGFWAYGAWLLGFWRGGRPFYPFLLFLSVSLSLSLPLHRNSLSLPLTSHFSVTFLSCFSFSPLLPLVSVSLLLTSVSFLSCFSFSSLFLFSPRHPHFFSFSPPLIRVLPLLFLFQPNVLLSC